VRVARHAFLLCGPSLAGKSTVCQRIVARLGAAVVSADAINASRGLPFGAEGLPESVWAETLRLQLDRLREHAGAGKSVVVDDTLCYRWLRDRFRAQAIAAELQPELLLLMPARDELLSRRARLVETTARPVLSLHRFVEHLDSFEWPTEDEAAVDVSTPAQLGAWLSKWTRS
jgi:predicted kinase